MGSGTLLAVKRGSAVLLALSYVCLFLYVGWMAHVYEELRSTGGTQAGFRAVGKFIWGSGLGLLGLVFGIIPLTRNREYGYFVIIAIILNLTCVLMPWFVAILVNLN